MEDWLSLRPAVIHIYRGAVPEEGANTAAARGGNHFAWLLERGSATVWSRGAATTAKAGEWLIADPGERYQLFTPDARIVSIHFQAKWPDGCQLFEEGLSLVLPSAEHPRLKQAALTLLRAMRGILPQAPAQIRATPLPVASYLEMQHLGLGFIATLAQALTGAGLIPSRAGRSDPRLLALWRELDRWPLHLPLDLARLAQQVGMGQDRLVRFFQQACGSTPRRYLEHRRLDFARRLIGHTAQPIKAIAFDLGFPAPADFTAWFKRMEGVAPNLYRQQASHSGDL